MSRREATAYTAANSELFVNPLMRLHFTVDLAGLAGHVGYLDQLEDTDHMTQVSLITEQYRDEVDPRRWRAISH
jgi:hypothetical protein